MPTDEGLMLLIEEGHISYFERGKFGFAGHDVVPFDRLVDVIARELVQNGRFPRRRTKFDVAEGMWVARDGAGFSVAMSRTAPACPNAVAEKSEKYFTKPEEAVRFFLKCECGLPGIWDGVKFV